MHVSLDVLSDISEQDVDDVGCTDPVRAAKVDKLSLVLDKLIDIYAMFVQDRIVTMSYKINLWSGQFSFLCERIGEEKG